ncbi:hypothetical protein [Pontiella agarivorans]|uniref:PEP-CTERM protein-sorting domain-containing protein n=1 Tax=Pontiella agarivorans TaxID=3038953 RepID=A0ABU5MVM3_9BACT|nr:hypothetical protein [Pontiella agarivorans]MDZ8118259.1 hypothetical protein [Pontiella agarivorans]
MKKQRNAILTGLLVTVLAAGQSMGGLLIDYDASDLPDSNTLANPFSSIVFAGTGYSLNGGELTLTTAPSAGIWFGNGNSIGHPTNWSLADSASGNYLKVRTKLAPGATSWSAYLADGSSYAGFTFNHSTVSYATDLAGSYNDVTNALDMTSDFHTFEFLLKDGNVTYRLDESIVLYHGAAYASSEGSFMVIGDGSGPTPTGTGSMIIDQVTYEAGPTFSIPEPSTLGLVGCFGSAVFLIRRFFLI